MIEILQKEKKVLHTQTTEVNLNEISGTKIQNIIKDMKTALDAEKEGVAIAANQIGEELKIFVVSGKIFVEGEDPINFDEIKKEDLPEDKVFINPKLIKTSKDKNWAEEGCLSVKNIYGFVERSKKASIRAYDENGKRFTLGGSGLLAQIFQHEIDHLNGILFTEKAKDLREITLSTVNVVFFGTSDFSVIVLEELKKADILPSLIITAPNKPKGRGLKMTPTEVRVWAEKNGIKILQPKDLEVELPSGICPSSHLMERLSQKKF